MGKDRILIIDDDPLIRWVLSQILIRKHYEVMQASSGKEGLDKFQQMTPDLIFLDINMPGMNGFEVLERIKRMDRSALVIMMSGNWDEATRKKAVSLGAYEFINKFLTPEQILRLVEESLKKDRLKRSLKEIKIRLGPSEYEPGGIIGITKNVAEVVRLIQKAAENPCRSALIQGERGTGKDLVAKSIHLQSKDWRKPFIKIDGTSFAVRMHRSEPLLQLLRYAREGTIFLDEISYIDLNTQERLLSLLDEETISGAVEKVRIIASTDKDLQWLLETGGLSKDLYERFMPLVIRILPLRERKDDILPLANYFIQQYNRNFKKNIKGVSDRAAQLLLSYHWPDNVRELKNVIGMAMILEKGEFISRESLIMQVVQDMEMHSIPAEEREDLIEKVFQILRGSHAGTDQLFELMKGIIRSNIKGVEPT